MELQTKTRTVLGKKTKHLRGKGLIPAELYGYGIENKHLELSEKEFSKLYKEAGTHTIIHIATEEGEKIPVLISEVQYHPLSGKPLSIDFHQVRMDKTIETSVPIEFKGVAPAEKNGFFVVRVLSEIDIETLPNNIPHSFEVDLSKLENLGQSIHVSEVKMPEGIKALVSPETVVVSVTEHEKEETPSTTETVTETTPETAKAETKPAGTPTPQENQGPDQNAGTKTETPGLAKDGK